MFVYQNIKERKHKKLKLVKYIYIYLKLFNFYTEE